MNDEESNQKSKVREGSIGWNVKQVANAMDQKLADSLKPMKLTIPEFKIVMTLIELGGVSQITLGKSVGLRSYAMTRNLDKLEERGLVQRKVNLESRRSHEVFLTKQGKDLAVVLFGIVNEVNNEVTSNLTESERKILHTLLRSVVIGLC